LNWNIEFLNFWHVAVLCLTVIAGFVFTFIFKNRSRKTKMIFLWVLALTNTAIYFIRTFRECDEAWFIIWENLPLHLCGMTVFIFPLALLIKNPLLKSFCYFISSAGGLMALLIPTVTFLGLPIYHISALSFYVQHMIITLFGVLLVSLRVIKPTWKSALGSLGVMGVITIFCHLVNVAVPALGLGGPECAPNYMFTVRADTNALLSLAYGLVPVDLVYLFLFIPLLAVICLVLLAPIYLPRWIKRAKAKKATNNA
jgi:uncharacterized membrane protein YwaF